MKEIIDLVLLGIIIVCTWSGYKKGLIMGVGGILCIIVSIYGANLVSNTFSGEVLPALKPFASGYAQGLIDSEDGIMEKMGWENYDYSLDDLLERYPEREEEFYVTAYESFGIDARSSAVMAADAMEYADVNEESVLNSFVHILCSRISYVACFVLAFLLIIIVLTVIGNLPNLSYKIPYMDLVNDIAGAVLGLATGIIFCALLVWALKFTGMIIGSSTLSETGIGGWFLEKDFMFKYLGI